MGKVSKIRAASKEIEVGGQTFEIEPLSNEELLEGMDMAESGQTKEFLKHMMVETLKKDDEDNTEEAIMKAPSTLMMKVMDAVEEVNDLDFLDEESKKEAMKELGWNNSNKGSVTQGSTKKEPPWKKDTTN